MWMLAVKSKIRKPQSVDHSGWVYRTRQEGTDLPRKGNKVDSYGWMGWDWSGRIKWQGRGKRREGREYREGQLKLRAILGPYGNLYMLPNYIQYMKMV